MSNIEKYMKQINSMKLTQFSNTEKVFAKNDENSESLGEDKLKQKQGEIALGIFKKTSRNMADINNKLTTKPIVSNTYSNNYSNNYFENTYMPCYETVGSSSLVIPTKSFKQNYIINKKGTDVNHIDNLLANTALDIEQKDPLYNHIYKFEKEFTIYNEPIITEGNRIKIGDIDVYTSTPWDNSVYTKLDGGNYWHAPPKNKNGDILNHEFYVLKSKSQYKWEISYSDNGEDWKEGWKNHSAWLKFEYINIHEQKVRASFIIKNIRKVNTLGTNYQLNNLFDGKTYSCRPIKLPTGESNNCSLPQSISTADYNYIKAKHADIFNRCNNEAFQNEYTNVKKRLGSGYILVSGLLMIYLIHRIFNRK